MYLWGVVLWFKQELSGFVTCIILCSNVCCLDSAVVPVVLCVLVWLCHMRSCTFVFFVLFNCNSGALQPAQLLLLLLQSVTRLEPRLFYPTTADTLHPHHNHSNTGTNT